MTLREKYQQQIIPVLMKEFGVANRMAVPGLQKIVINIGLKEAVSDRGVLEKTMSWLGAITGQKPKVTRARLSIANFKVRAGDAVGVMVTLRGKRMYDFFTKLVTIVLPRVRDFQGLPVKSFDPQGNYTLGISEQIVFPEVDYSQIDRVRGLEITLVTNSNPQLAKRLLELLGLPFAKT